MQKYLFIGGPHHGQYKEINMSDGREILVKLGNEDKWSFDRRTGLCVNENLCIYDRTKYEAKNVDGLFLQRIYVYMPRYGKLTNEEKALLDQELAASTHIWLKDPCIINNFSYWFAYTVYKYTKDIDLYNKLLKTTVKR